MSIDAIWGSLGGKKLEREVVRVRADVGVVFAV
jgi:hypothetical protein